MVNIFRKFFLTENEEFFCNKEMLIINKASAITQGSTGNLPEISWRFKYNSSAQTTTFFKSVSETTPLTKVVSDSVPDSKVSSLLAWMPYIVSGARLTYSLASLAYYYTKAKEREKKQQKSGDIAKEYKVQSSSKQDALAEEFEDAQQDAMTSPFQAQQASFKPEVAQSSLPGFLVRRTKEGQEALENDKIYDEEAIRKPHEVKKSKVQNKPLKERLENANNIIETLSYKKMVDKDLFDLGISFSNDEYEDVKEVVTKIIEILQDRGKSCEFYYNKIIENYASAQLCSSYRGI